VLVAVWRGRRLAVAIAGILVELAVLITVLITA